MSKRYSASEILAMNLAGLPKTKVGLLARADREKWPYTQTRGLGGPRKVFEVPQEYLVTDGCPPGGTTDFIGRPGVPISGSGLFVKKDSQAALEKHYPTPEIVKVAGTIVAGSSKVDTVKLELAIRALTEWETERAVKIDASRRPAVIAILYDYLQNAEGQQGEAAMAMVLRALG